MDTVKLINFSLGGNINLNIYQIGFVSILMYSHILYSYLNEIRIFTKYLPYLWPYLQIFTLLKFICEIYKIIYLRF